MTDKYVVWFSEVGKGDGGIVGGKGANLGEMTKAGIPVPNGFIVTAQAYFAFLKETDLKEKIRKILDPLDVSDSEKLQKASRRVHDLVMHEEMPDDIASPILDAYSNMGKMFASDPYVAIRSSATAEDLPDASFAGQQETFLNISGDASVVYYVRKAWASLFTARAIFYRVEKKFDHFKVGIAVPVQKMVQSDTSGVMFTLDPVTNDKTTLTIEAIYGLGEMIVQGQVTPDHYEVKKSTLEIIKKTIADQPVALTMVTGKTKERAVPTKEQGKQKITDKHIVELAQLGKKLEKHYYFPQDIEWAIEKGTVFITQTRPVTTAKESDTKNGDQVESAKSADSLLSKLPLIATGDPASPGIGSGHAKIIRKASEIKKITRGDVLVASQTNPDYVPAMRRASAIVTEKGGRTSHAAIVSRELGIPAVVGAPGVTTKIKENEVVTVHGKEGKIYRGALQSGVLQAPATMMRFQNSSEKLKTATKVYVNLAEVSRVEEMAKSNADGVGLLRAEFMIADIGTHPKKLIHEHRQSVFVNKLSENLAHFCTSFGERPVIYRATDFKTNEYRNLKGGKEYEPVESNPMMGYRGAYRYISDEAVFNLELEAIKQVRNKHGLKNLWLMIPYVHTPAEMLEVKKIVAASGLRRGGSFRLLMMVEIPSNVILIEDFIETGIDGVSIGSNDLTQLTLGVDRDNSEVARVFDERNAALSWSFERVIKACLKHNVTVSMCGQAPSDYPELVEKLVNWGITSISVNPDMVDNVRETIYEAEKKLVRKTG